MFKSIVTLIVLIALVPLLTGCYANRSEMYTARSDYYNAQGEALKEYAKNVNRPLVTFTTPTGNVFTVNNPTPVAMPVITQERNAWVDVWKATVTSTPLSILAGGWSAMKLLKYSSGDVNIKGDGNTASPTSNSYNTETTDISNASGEDSTVDQHTDNSDSSSVDSSDNSNNSDNRTDYDNQTATPIIVEQPAPVIVNPVVINPVIADPYVIEPYIITAPTPAE